MARHAQGEPDQSSVRPEPVAIAAAIQAVLAAVVTLGWLQLDNAAQSIVTTAVAAVISLIATLVARKKVTPVADPRIEE